jgi:hypothetical protein
MRMRLAAAAAGAVLIAAAVLAFSLGKHPVVAGTNTVSPVFPAFSAASGGTQCQLVSRVPAKASHVRLVVTSFQGERPVVQVKLTDRHGAVATSEMREAVPGGLVLPLRERTRAAHPANLCISSRGDGKVVFAGEEKRLPDGDASNALRGGVASVAFLRPGSSSWAARRDLIAERYANSQSGALGEWSLWTALAFAVIAFAFALWWLVFRPEGVR